MEYCIVEDGVIVNIIVAEADFAAEIGALPGYDGAAIGGAAHHRRAGDEAGNGKQQAEKSAPNAGTAAGVSGELPFRDGRCCLCVSFWQRLP